MKARAHRDTEPRYRVAVVGPPKTPKEQSVRGQLSNLIIGRALASLMQAAALVLLGREAGVADFGFVAAVSGAGLVWFSVADLGIGSFITRARALGRDDQVAGALHLNFRATLLFGGIAVLLLLALAGFHDVALALIPLAVAFALEKNVDTTLGIAVADGDRWSPSVSILLRRGFGLALFALMGFTGVEPVLAYALAYLAGCLIAQAHIRLHVLRKAALLPTVVRTKTVALVKLTYPFLLNHLSGQLRSLDSTVVTIAAGNSVGGLYSAASRLSAPLLLIPGALATLVMPHSATVTPRSARRVAALITGATLAVGALLSPSILFSSTIMEYLFGAEFRDAGPAFGWTVVGTTFIALSAPLSAVLQGQGHEKFVGSIGALFGVLALSAVFWGATAGGAMLAAAMITLTFVIKCIVLGIAIALPGFGRAALPSS